MLNGSLERISSPHKLSPQTNEFVLSCKNKSGLFKGQIPDFKPKAKSISVSNNLDLQGYPVAGSINYIQKLVVSR